MSIAAEQAVAVAVMNSAESFELANEVLKSHDFFDMKARLIWDAVYAYRTAPRAIDMITLAAVLDKSNRWKEIGVKTPALDYLAALDAAADQYQDVVEYSNVIKSASVDRQLFDYGDAVKKMAHNGDISTLEKLATIHSLLEPLSENEPTGFITAKEAAMQACADIEAAMARDDGLAGLSTGYDCLDTSLGGLMDSNLYFVGARPSMGKSIFMMNIAVHVARTDPVQIFSMEMPAKDLMKRTISQFGTINVGDLMRGRLTEQEQSRLFVAGKEIAALDLTIDDSSGLTIDQICMRVRVAARQRKPRLIMLDYLTLIKTMIKNQSKHQQVTEDCVRLKGLAKEMQCPVVVLAQLNRGLEQRPNKRPMLADLRESGGIEEAADVVLFLYRDEVYNEDTATPELLEVINAKGRNNAKSTQYLKAELQYARFRNFDGPVPEPQERAPEGKPFAGWGKGGKAANTDGVSF